MNMIASLSLRTGILTQDRGSSGVGEDFCGSGNEFHRIGFSMSNKPWHLLLG
jgi:hypothetical protein